MATSHVSQDASPISSLLRVADARQALAGGCDESPLESAELIAGEGWAFDESVAAPIVERVSGRNLALPLVVGALVALIGIGLLGRLSASSAGASPGEGAAGQTALLIHGRSAGEERAGQGSVEDGPRATTSDAVRPHALSTTEWEALYGPAAATWGVWESPHSLTDAEWEALYGPAAATWGVWESPRNPCAGAADDPRRHPCADHCPR